MSDFVETPDTLRARCRRDALSYDLADYPNTRALLAMAASLTRGNPRADKAAASWASRQIQRHVREWRAGESLSVADIPPPVEQPKSEEESCFGRC